MSDRLDGATHNLVARQAPPRAAWWCRCISRQERSTDALHNKIVAHGPVMMFQMSRSCTSRACSWPWQPNS
jgi:hypothetical protein